MKIKIKLPVLEVGLKKINSKWCYVYAYYYLPFIEPNELKEEIEDLKRKLEEYRNSSTPRILRMLKKYGHWHLEVHDTNEKVELRIIPQKLRGIRAYIEKICSFPILLVITYLMKKRILYLLGAQNEDEF